MKEILRPHFTKPILVKVASLVRIIIFMFCVVLADTLSVTAQTTITKQVIASSDDAEEEGSGGSMHISSTDLEMVDDNNDYGPNQKIGLRFTTLAIPVGATITSAYLTFRADASSSATPISLLLKGQAADNPTAFSSSNFQVTSRATSTASVSWTNISAWSSGSNYNTPDLSTIVQEIVNRPGWVSGNAMVFFVTGTSGVRSAVSYDGGSSNAPRLTITYVTCTPIATPVFTLGATSSRCQGASSITYTATSTNSTGITYSLDAASISAGNTIVASTGAVTYVAGWSGTTTITATAAGCQGPKTASHTVTIAANVSAPIFSAGSSSGRCIGAGTITYTATAANATGISYSLDAFSLTSGLTISSSTGAVSFPVGWSGTSTITANATGCNGSTASTTHTVTSAAIVAVNDVGTGVQGNPVLVNVLANDLCDVNPSSVTIASQPTNGTVQIGTNGALTYLPNGSFFGTDTYTYQVCSNANPGLCSSATVTITITESLIDPCSEANKSKTYYLPFPENTTQLRKALISAASLNALTNAARTIISVKVLYPGTIITYDHWEDGYESNITVPIQTTTQIWGDGNTVNGFAPGYPSDILPSGAYIVFDQQFAYNPRVVTTVVPDGKDKIYSSNDLAISKVSGDAGLSGSNAIFDVQNVKTNVVDITRFGKLFVIPFGEDLTLGGTGAFKYTGLFVRASVNNTVVSLDYNHDGIVDVTSPTLSEGEVWFYDGTASSPGTASNVNNANDIKAGAIVTSNNPVGVDLIFGGIDNYGTRNIAILPGAYYGATYYSPVYTTNSNAPVYAFFTNSLSTSITINWTAGTGASGSVVVPANGNNYLSLSQTAAYKFVSVGNKSYTAVVVIDADAAGQEFDWAFNMIPDQRLSTLSSIAWAPGSSDFSTNTSPVWVTAPTATTVYVKYDGNLTTGGSISPCGIHYNVAIPLTALQSYRVLDAADNNQTGMAIYTCDGTKIAAVWGEDPSTAATGSPSMDVGYTLEPKCLSQLVFANDDRNTTPPNTPATVDVLNNDVGFLLTLDPSTVSIAGLLQPAHGTIVVNANGSITYTPNNGYLGRDTFEYRVCGINYAGVCDVAQVIMNITDCGAAVNENLISGKVFLEQLPDDAAYNSEKGVDNVKVYLYNDINCDGIINGSDAKSDSTYSDVAGNYQFSTRNAFEAKDDFDPTASFAGNDGSVGWNANWVESGDDNVITAGDVQILTDPSAGGTGNAIRLGNASNGISRASTFVNATGAYLRFSFRRESLDDAGEAVNVTLNGSTVYTINDGDLVGTDGGYTNVSITLASFNANAANTVAFTTNSSTGSGDFFWIDNIELTYTKAAACFVMIVDPSSTASYSPSALSKQTAAPSGLQNCDKDNYLGVLAKLVVTDDVTTTGIDLPVIINILQNDVTGIPNPSTVTTAGVLQPAHGTVTVNANGTVTYTPNPGYSGTDVFEYKVCSLEEPALCDIAQVTVTISCAFVPNKNVINGIVFTDANANGILNIAEAGKTAVGVNLYQDTDADGVLDAGEPLLQTAATNATGAYEFVIDVPTTSFTVRDEFATNGVGTGNNGTANWSTNWVEVGESNGFITADVNVTGNRLHIANASRGAMRSANLTGATTATFSFDFQKQNLEGDETMLVQVASSSAPASWTTLLSMPATNVTSSSSFDISSFISSATTIRFISGSGNGGDDYFFDNVQISYDGYSTATRKFIVQLAQPIQLGTTLTTPAPSPTGIQTATFTTQGGDCQNNFGLTVPVSINGIVFNDVTGYTDSRINDGAVYSVGGLFANLVGSDDKVIASVPVGVNGIYGFAAADGVRANTTYKVILTNTTQTAGSTLLTASVPYDWKSTGEYVGSGSGNDGAANGILTVTTTIQPASNANFGIQQPPVAGEGNNQDINPGGITQVSVPANTFTKSISSSDYGTGSVMSIRITAFPAGASSVIINGITYTITGGGGTTSWPVGGVIVPTDVNGNPTQAISADPASNSNTSVVFRFVAIDNAGAESTNLGTAELQLTMISISGTVYHDADGGGINGIPTNTVGSNTLYVSLVDGSNKVVASVPVNGDGTYSFGTADGLAANTSYLLVLSNTQGTPGSAPPSNILTNAINTAEGTPPAGDGTPNGYVGITVGTASLTNINFAVEELPTAGSGANTVANPGGTTQVTVPLTTFTNITPTTDPDGTVPNIRITGFPTGAASVVINGTTYTAAGGGGTTAWPAAGVITPVTSLGSVDPAFNGAGDVVFSFKAIDNLGKEGQNTGTATLHFLIPDLTPVIRLPSNGFAAAGSQADFVAELVSLIDITTTAGSTRFSITAPVGYTISFSPSLTTITAAGAASATVVQNPSWTLVSTQLGGRRLNFQAKVGVSIGALQKAELGFTLTRTSSFQGSVPVVTINIADDAGWQYDSVPPNNIFTRILNSL